MFSGIVQGVGAIQKIRTSATGGASFTVENNSGIFRDLAVGASVAVDGVCLSKTGGGRTTADFDAVPETLSRTTLSALRVGDAVNLERALRVGDENGGHPISGHVHCTAQIKQIKQQAGCYDIVLADLPPQYRPYLIAKGFVAVNGTSLTVGKVTDNGFYLHLVPETLRQATWREKKVGDKVNIECDQTTVAIVDTVVRLLPQIAGDTTQTDN